MWFRIDNVEDFDIQNLPKDMDELQRIYGMPIGVAYDYKLFETVPDSSKLFDARIYTMDEGKKIPFSEERKNNIFIAELEMYAISNIFFGLVGYKLLLDYEKQKEEKLSRKKSLIEK